MASSRRKKPEPEPNEEDEEPYEKRQKLKAEAAKKQKQGSPERGSKATHEPQTHAAPVPKAFKGIEPLVVDKNAEQQYQRPPTAFPESNYSKVVYPDGRIIWARHSRGGLTQMRSFARYRSMRIHEQLGITFPCKGISPASGRIGLAILPRIGQPYVN